MTAQSGLGFSGIVAIQIPDDGATGEVLTKLTPDNYDYDWAAGGGGGAPDDAQYVVLALDATLTNERVLTPGTSMQLTDGGAGGLVTLDVEHLEFVAVAANPGGTAANTLYMDDGTNFDADTVVMGDFSVPMLLTGNVGINDPGTEQGGINVGGVNFDATAKINDFGGTIDAMLVLHRHSTSFGSNLVLSRSNSDTSAHIALTAGQTISQFVNVGWSGTHYDIATIMQTVVPTGTTVSPTSLAGQIEFYTTPDLSNTALLALLIGSDQSIQFSGAYTFPTADGALGDVLVTDGAGALTFQAASGLTTLQDAYNNAPAEPQISAAAGDPVGFEPAADPGDIFFLQRADAGRVFLVESLATGYEFTLGPAGNRSWVLSEPTTTSNPTTAIIIPDGRTKTVLPAADNSAIIYWDTTFISNIPGGGGIGNDSGFGAIFLVGTLELLEQGNLFSTSIVFNQATRIDTTAANSGPIYTMVNQPVMRNFGATNRTVSQANAVRSQLRIEPNSTGDVTQVSHETFFATIILDSSISTGDAFCTTCNYFAAKAPGFLGVGGAITTLNCLDIANIPIAGITNLRGINSAMAAGIFINHTGIAPSFFGGTVELDDSVILQLGDTSGAQFSRIASSGFRVEGFGGANNEGLDFDFQTPDNIGITPTAAAGINVNSIEFAFGPGSTADGTNNWVMIFAPGLRATSLAGDYSEVLFSSSSAISIAHAISTFATWTVNAPTAVLGAGSVVNAANVNIQTSMAVGTNRYGLLVTSNPSGGTLNYAARFTGSTGVRIDGLFEHTGTLVGLYGATPVAQSAAYTPTNVTPDRSYDANATTVNELADVVGTMIADLQAIGIYG